MVYAVKKGRVRGAFKGRTMSLRSEALSPAEPLAAEVTHSLDPQEVSKEALQLLERPFAVAVVVVVVVAVVCSSATSISEPVVAVVVLAVMVEK